MFRRPVARAIALCWLVLQSAALAVAPLAMQCLHDHRAAAACAQGHHGAAGAHDHGHGHAAAGHAQSSHGDHADGPKMRCLCLVSESAVNALTLGAALLPHVFTWMTPAPALASGRLESSPLSAAPPIDTPPPRA